MPTVLWEPSPEEQEKNSAYTLQQKSTGTVQAFGLRISDFAPVVNRLSGTILGRSLA